MLKRIAEAFDGRVEIRFVPATCASAEVVLDRFPAG